MNDCERLGGMARWAGFRSLDSTSSAWGGGGKPGPLVNSKCYTPGYLFQVQFCLFHVPIKDHKYGERVHGQITVKYNVVIEKNIAGVQVNVFATAIVVAQWLQKNG